MDQFPCILSLDQFCPKATLRRCIASPLDYETWCKRRPCSQPRLLQSENKQLQNAVDGTKNLKRQDVTDSSLSLQLRHLH